MIPGKMLLTPGLQAGVVIKLTIKKLIPEGISSNWIHASRL